MRPNEQRSFVEEWLKLRSDVKELKGNVKFTLSKVRNTDLINICLGLALVPLSRSSIGSALSSMWLRLELLCEFLLAKILQLSRRCSILLLVCGV